MSGDLLLLSTFYITITSMMYRCVTMTKSEE